jgi:hypothetical protein
LIDQWKTELHKYGFEYKKWSSSEKAFVKHVDNFEQQIWQESVRKKPHEIFLNAYISIKDPFRGEYDFRVVLNGRVAINEIIIPRSDTGVGRLWKKEESTEALELLVNVALPWFDENSRLEKLIDYVTNDVVIKPISSEQTPSSTGFFKDLSLFRFQNKQDDVEIITRPNNRLLLSLLHYHAGNLKVACEQAMEWLKYVQSHPTPGEPDRTLRQLKGMGCS